MTDVQGYRRTFVLKIATFASNRIDDMEERDIPFAMRVPRKPVSIRLDESLKKLDDLEDGPVSTYPLSDARVDTAPTLFIRCEISSGST